MSPGRNAPCPCGSGRKYKKCCLLKEQAADELTPRAIIRCDEEATNALLAFARCTHGEDWFSDVMSDFWITDQPGDLDSLHDDPFTPLMMSWAMYVRVDLDDEEDVLFLPSDRTIAAQFLHKAAWSVDEPTRRYIEAARRAPLVFHQVMAVEAGRGVLLRDLLTDRERFVDDRSVAETAQTWSILFGHVIEMPDTCVFNGIGPYMLPPSAFRRPLEDALANWRERLQDSPQDYVPVALGLDLNLIEMYHDCVDQLLHPPTTDFRNTDGDKLEWSRSVYTLDPEARDRVIGRLESMRNIELSHTGDDEQIEETAFVWISQRRDGPVPNAHRGILRVFDDHLQTECNSRKRDRLLRARLLKRLGDLLEHVDTEHERLDPASLRDRAPDAEQIELDFGLGTQHGASSDAPTDRPGGPMDLSQLPEEARSRIEEAMAGQFLRWADTEVLALGGKTPRQMVATAAGRTEVEKMINDWEHRSRSAPSTQVALDFSRLRRELGLTAE